MQFIPSQELKRSTAINRNRKIKEDFTMLFLFYDNNPGSYVTYCIKKNNSFYFLEIFVLFLPDQRA